MGYPHCISTLFKKCFLAGLAALSTGARAAPAPELPSSPAAWRAAARADIESAVQVTRDNHPGAHDPHNPDFLHKLDEARRHGLALAAQVNNAAGYVAAIEGFNTRIGDGHAGLAVRIDKSALPRPRWPGFVTVWRGDGLYVHNALAGQPAVGSKLVACDGKAPEQAIWENVFGFQGRLAEAGQWWALARDLFIDTHNPFVQRPQRCSFASGGKVREHLLAWRDIDAQAERWLAESSHGETRPIGMTEPRKNLYWVSMPSFHPDEAERATYRSINHEIAQHRARYLGAEAIVVDLRSKWRLIELGRGFCQGIVGRRPRDAGACRLRREDPGVVARLPCQYRLCLLGCRAAGPARSAGWRRLGQETGRRDARGPAPWRAVPHRAAGERRRPRLAGGRWTGVHPSPVCRRARRLRQRLPGRP